MRNGHGIMCFAIMEQECRGSSENMLTYAKILVVYTVRSKFRVYFECRANQTVVEWICVKTRIKDEFPLLLAAQLKE